MAFARVQAAAQPFGNSGQAHPSADANAAAVQIDPGTGALNAAALGAQLASAPVVVSSPVAAAAANPANAPAQPPAQTPLTGQISGPLFSLAGAKPGEHTMTISVTPDNLGPVTVRAHISAGDIRLELFAPNDAGRDALRAILPDLKRDLAGTGMNANLDLASGNQPGNQSGSQSGNQPGSQTGAQNGQSSRGTPSQLNAGSPDVRRGPAAGTVTGARSSRSADSTLDVLA